MSIEQEESRPSREAQILSLAAEGLTDRQISLDLDISLATVDTYWRRIRAKFGASSRTEAVAKALNLRSASAITLAQRENDRLVQQMHEHIQIERELQERIASDQIVAAGKVHELKALLENLWRTHLLMGNLGAVMWWARPEAPWTIDWISDSVAQWGYEASELKEQKSLLSLVHEDDALSFEAGALLALLGESEPLEREYRIITAKGDVRLVRERLTSMVTPVRNERSLIGIQMDVSPAG